MIWIGRNLGHLVQTPLPWQLDLVPTSLPWPETPSTRPGYAKPHPTWL